MLLLHLPLMQGAICLWGFFKQLSYLKPSQTLWDNWIFTHRYSHSCQLCRHTNAADQGLTSGGRRCGGIEALEEGSSGDSTFFSSPNFSSELNTDLKEKKILNPLILGQSSHSTLKTPQCTVG